MSTRDCVSFVHVCVLVDGVGTCCYTSKGCADIHFRKYGSALVETTALEGFCLDGKAQSGRTDQDRLDGRLAAEDLSGVQ